MIEYFKWYFNGRPLMEVVTFRGDNIVEKQEMFFKLALEE